MENVCGFFFHSKPESMLYKAPILNVGKKFPPTVSIVWVWNKKSWFFDMLYNVHKCKTLNLDVYSMKFLINHCKGQKDQKTCDRRLQDHEDIQIANLRQKIFLNKVFLPWIDLVQFYMFFKVKHIDFIHYQTQWNVPIGILICGKIKLIIN